MKPRFLDLASALFVLGGVIGLVISALSVPLSSIYPFDGLESLNLTYFVVVAIEAVSSFGAIHCYILVTNLQLASAGLRGMIFGAILLAVNVTLVGRIQVLNSLGIDSAILVLIAGVVCFVLRESLE
jgi:hypothetical protein